MQISQWFKDFDQDRSWDTKAECQYRLDLPWIADEAPGVEHYGQMYDVCMACPVLAQCADHALRGNGGRGVEGGFYAGVWIPWSAHNGDRNSTRNQFRRSARHTLRSVIR